MNAFRKKVAGAAFGGSLLLGGVAAVIAQSGSASAADTTDTTIAASADTSAVTATPEVTAAPVAAAAPAAATDPSKGGHTANGITEVLLTGDTAAQANTAALAAVPGATVDRVENDAEGATYEAHMTKADGSHVTVKFDASFNVTSIESGR
jgi:uncharacterized membrane protein YkoI